MYPGTPTMTISEESFDSDSTQYCSLDCTVPVYYSNPGTPTMTISEESFDSDSTQYCSLECTVPVYYSNP